VKPGIWTALTVAAWLGAAPDVWGADKPTADRPAAAMPPADANVIIYRKYAEPIWPATIVVDGRKIVTMGNKGYTALKLEPGGHRIRLAWNFLTGGVDVPVDLVVEPGATHYVEIVGSSRVEGSQFKVENGFMFVEPAAGADDVARCCRYHAPK
jgi:hypothetical protein